MEGKGAARTAWATGRRGGRVPVSRIAGLAVDHGAQSGCGWRGDGVGDLLMPAGARPTDDNRQPTSRRFVARGTGSYSARFEATETVQVRAPIVARRTGSYSARFEATETVQVRAPDCRSVGRAPAAHDSKPPYSFGFALPIVARRDRKST